MAIEAVVSVVLKKLTDMLKWQSLNQNIFIVHEVQEIINSLDSLRDLMISIKQINQLGDEFLDAVYMVEDGIENFTLSVVRRRKVFGFLTNHIFFFNNFKSCHKIHHKIKNITTQLIKIKDRQHYQNPNPPLTPAVSSLTLETQIGNEVSFSYSCNEEVMQIVGIKRMSSFSYEEEVLGIFGLKEDADNLVTELTNDSSQHVVTVVGERGIGKTTLARTIYKNRDIKGHFQFRAWVSMLDYYTTKDVLLTLLKATDSMTDKASNMDDEKAVKLRFSEYLKNKRYLVILDDISNFDILADINEIFRDVNNGSKLVLTSSQTVETTRVSIFSHSMMPLSKEDSLKLFKEKIGNKQSSALVSEKSKQAVLESCKGLPLNIILLAGLFYMKDPSIWSQEFYSEQNSTNILSLCYDDLSDHLKVCLLYSVLFPKDFDIPVRRLLRLWLAEGFVNQNSAKVLPEDIAQTYFEELANRNLIQISKLRADNSPRRCRVLGVVHDYLLPKAQKTNLFYTFRNLMHCEDVRALNVRRMVEYESPKREQENDSRENKIRNHFGNETANPSSPKSSLFNPSRLRSYMSFNHQKTDYRQAKQIGSILGNIINDGFGLLRVLDLEGVYKPILPENIGNLCNLRYLGLRLTYLDSLPPSVGELSHLETLDLKHTCIDELPSSICKLKKLHYLNLNEMCLNMQAHSSLRLLTLWGLFLDEKAVIKDGLDKLHDLRELGISFMLSSKQEELMDWIANLTDLRSLRLRSKDKLGCPSNLLFRSMSNLVQLSHLNLLGNLEKLPGHNEFPPTLKVLTLSFSLLNQDPMQTLGQLPCLTVLRLLGQSYIGKEMVCNKGRFTKLRVLKMWMLKELESWVVEEGSMKSLKVLDIRCCSKLGNIPTKLLEKQQLEKVVLTGMPDIFTTEVERLKSDHTSMTINHWKFPKLSVSC